MRALLALLCLVCASAQAFGPAGHRIVGWLAESRLCPAAAEQVELLGAGESLAELGLWADRVRGEAGWRHSAPWHYMNIDDDGPLEDYRTPPEGDILWALRHFTERAADSSLPDAERSEALKFVVHFIADLHQPLHVGRARDRGGNRILVRLDGRQLNLHRFWDSEVIGLEHFSAREYAERIEPMARANELAWAAQPVEVWAAESQQLRPFVYAFEGPELDEDYLHDARRITAQRLAQAGVRLAATLNGLFCSGS